VCAAAAACGGEAAPPFGGEPCGPDDPCPAGYVCHATLGVCGIPATVDAAVPDAGDPCAAALECIAPGAGTSVRVCGRAYDVTTSAERREALSVTFYEPLTLFGQGLTATPLATTETDACGRFASPEVTKQSTDLMAILIDDPAGAAGDGFLPTAVAVRTPDAGAYPGLAVWATATETAAAWGAAGGAFLELLLDPSVGPLGPLPGTPVAGATVTAGAAAARYFADADPLSRTTPSDTMTATVADGAALLDDFGSTLAGPPAGCVWPSGQDGSGVIPGVLVVAAVLAVCE
jgi:hypothetical protein